MIPDEMELRRLRTDYLAAFTKTLYANGESPISSAVTILLDAARSLLLELTDTLNPLSEDYESAKAAFCLIREAVSKIPEDGDELA
jgi:hypothetical protein